MGHQVCTSTYDAKNIDKAEVEEYWNQVAIHDDWEEGCSGLYQPIRWIDYTCKNYEEACDYIEEHDDGWYDQLAVKYKEGRKIKWLVKIEYHT